MKMSNDMKEGHLIFGECVELPTKHGYFKLIPFKDRNQPYEHIILVKGEVSEKDSVLLRIHSACATGDLFGSMRCDCGDQLMRAMQLIEQEGRGVIIYLNQEGRGIGLMNKIKAYKLQEQGLDTVDANLQMGFAPDERDYALAVKALEYLKIFSVRLLTNNPEKISGLEKGGIAIHERIPLIIYPNEYNLRYLSTKEKRMGHWLKDISMLNYT
jgi:3,4-dihydroxy 2-butanone 4-phosphate synthase/GTP cyclohydrolase II